MRNEIPNKENTMIPDTKIILFIERRFNWLFAGAFLFLMGFASLGAL